MVTVAQLIRWLVLLLAPTWLLTSNTQLIAQESKQAFAMDVKLLGIGISENPRLKWGAHIKIEFESKKWPEIEERLPKIKSIDILPLRNLCTQVDQDNQDNPLISKSVKKKFDVESPYVIVVRTPKKEKCHRTPIKRSSDKKERAEVAVPSWYITIPFEIGEIPNRNRRAKLSEGGDLLMLWRSAERSELAYLNISLFPSGIYSISVSGDGYNEIGGLSYPSSKYRGWQTCHSRAVSDGIISQNVLVKCEPVGK